MLGNVATAMAAAPRVPSVMAMTPQPPRAMAMAVQVPTAQSMSAPPVITSAPLPPKTPDGTPVVAHTPSALGTPARGRLSIPSSWIAQTPETPKASSSTLAHASPAQSSREPWTAPARRDEQAPNYDDRSRSRSVGQASSATDGDSKGARAWILQELARGRSLARPGQYGRGRPAPASVITVEEVARLHFGNSVWKAKNFLSMYRQT
mmetsp:Transcript_164354/g.290994  ORF Transcript_164354/g.290994 Transcript_164354/m.290994 type:complete len:207 (-) Transcript_164354:66-686(-)